MVNYLCVSLGLRQSQVNCGLATRVLFRAINWIMLVSIVKGGLCSEISVGEMISEIKLVICGTCLVTK